MRMASNLESLWSESREASDALFRILVPGALYERAVEERHRFLFYLGHLEAFDWNLLGKRALSLPAFHAEWDQLFAFGIDPGADALPTDKPEDWPSAVEVRGYVARVRDALDAHLDGLPEQLLHVAMEHRWMHVETLSYLLHNLDPSKKHGTDGHRVTRGLTPKNALLEVSPGRVVLGQRAGGFGWDNEFPCHHVDVGAFRMQQHKVTNGEYLRFVEAGGPAPHFWRLDGSRWMLRCMFSEMPLPLDWPVYVTHVQATAYAAWAGMRLPTEAEFQRAAYGQDGGGERSYPWGEEAPSAAHGNFGLFGWNPVPVDAHPGGNSAFGLWQMVGNGWEWTATPFAPFEGFQPFPFYPGYSADFFDNQHYVLKGGSSRTAVPLLRRSFRNWFRPEYRYAFASFRCVTDA